MRLLRVQDIAGSAVSRQRRIDLIAQLRPEAAPRAHPTAVSYKIGEWRATADEDGHYCFAVAL
jgi:hypothetical protein